MNALIMACDAGLLKPDEAQLAILAVKEGLDLPANAAEAIAPERGVRDAERLDQMELAAKAKARLGISKPRGLNDVLDSSDVLGVVKTEAQAADEVASDGHGLTYTLHMMDRDHSYWVILKAERLSDLAVVKECPTRALGVPVPAHDKVIEYLAAQERARGSQVSPNARGSMPPEHYDADRPLGDSPKAMRAREAWREGRAHTGRSLAGTLTANAKIRIRGAPSLGR